MQKRPEGPIGDALLERFSTLDILESNDEQILLVAHPRLAAQVRLVQMILQRSWDWMRSWRSFAAQPLPD